MVWVLGISRVSSSMFGSKRRWLVHEDPCFLFAVGLNCLVGRILDWATRYYFSYGIWLSFWVHSSSNLVLSSSTIEEDAEIVTLLHYSIL